MPGVHRDREHRTLLPFEDVPPAIAVEPHLGGAAALDDEIDLLVEVLFRFERVGARHLDDVGAPFALGAVELDIRAFPAQPLPWRKRQILHLAHADIAIDGNALRFHEQVVGRLGPAERAETGSVVAGRLMPVRPAGQFMHGDVFSRLRQSARVLYCQPRSKARQQRLLRSATAPMAGRNATPRGLLTHAPIK